MAERRPGWWFVAPLGLLLAGAAWWLWRAGQVPASEVAATEPGLATASGTGPRTRPLATPGQRGGLRASVAGSVRDPQGRPVAGAQVCALALSDRLADSAWAQADGYASGADSGVAPGHRFEHPPGAAAAQDR